MAVWPNGKALDYDKLHVQPMGIKRFQVRPLARSCDFLENDPVDRPPCLFFLGAMYHILAVLQYQFHLIDHDFLSCVHHNLAKCIVLCSHYP